MLLFIPLIHPLGLFLFIGGITLECRSPPGTVISLLLQACLSVNLQEWVQNYWINIKQVMTPGLLLYAHLWLLL